MDQKKILVNARYYRSIVNWFLNCFRRQQCVIAFYLHLILMKVKSNPSLTILTIVFGLLVFNYFLNKDVIFYCCLLLSGIGVFSNKISIIIENIWFKLSFILSQIIPNILLSLIFFLILTPLSLLSKLFDSKTDFNAKNNRNTMFKTQNKSFDKNSFERAW